MPEFFSEEPDGILSVELDADFSSFRHDIGEATRLARRFGTALSSAFEGAIVKGRSLSDVLRDLAIRLARLALDAALKPLASGLSSAIGAALQGALPFADGGIVKAGNVAGGAVQAFASGGILAGSSGAILREPLAFPLRGGFGLAGEAGPEAILPLRRGPDGRLGVAAAGGQGQAPVHVTFNIQTPDVDGFHRARGQIAADLSRALDRGYRNR
ncbi:phage tail tape measure protein [Microbaculum marinum]|uniref:Phage tail tape measure protein n=1 Tax=Microbaculum marinum TaxID=1764581 RepID=A0AAW9RHJ3_9HYPH